MSVGRWGVGISNRPWKGVGVYTREERCGDITKNGDGNESIGGVVGVDRTRQRRRDEDDYRTIRRPDAMRAWSTKIIN